MNLIQRMLIIFYALTVILPGTLLADETPRARISRLNKDEVKVFWRFPVTGRFSAEDSWVEIVRCSSEETCSDLIEVIPLKRVLSRGTFEVKFDGNRSIALYYRDSTYGAKGVLIASQMFSQFWFPRTEICEFRAAKPQCFYTLDLEESAKSLKLNVYFKKEGESSK